MEVLPREVSVGEVAVFKMPIDFDGLLNETWFARCPKQEQPVYLLLKNI